MKITKAQETLTLSYIDGTWLYRGDWQGWSNPTRAFFLTLGWTEVVPPPPSVPTLADRQAQVWEMIKAHRDRLEDGGVLVAGKWWHTDIKSRAKYLGLMLMGAAVDGIQWKTMDGTMQALSQALVGQVFQGVAVADTTNFANAEAHRMVMVTASNLPVEDVGHIEPESYDYSTGWTGSYSA